MNIMGISRYRNIYRWTYAQLDAIEFAMETDLHIDKLWREGGKLKTVDDLSLSMIIKKLSLERSRLNKDTTQNNILIVKTRKLPLSFQHTLALLYLMSVLLLLGLFALQLLNV